MHIAHMDGFEGRSSPGGATLVMEVDRSAPSPKRPGFVPGVLRVFETRTETPTYVGEKTANFFDTHNRSPVVQNLGNYAGADWLPEPCTY